MIHITYLSGNETFLTRPLDIEALHEVLRKECEITTITAACLPITENPRDWLINQAAQEWVQKMFPGYHFSGMPTWMWDWQKGSGNRCACPAEARHGETSVWCCNECGLPVE
jgi:hypothetical protein